MRLYPNDMLVLLLFDVMDESIECKSPLSISTSGGHYRIIVQFVATTNVSKVSSVVCM